MIHLHCHSHYSLLCGASSPEDLVRRAAAFGQPALAQTDLNGLYGAIDFQKACEAAGLRAIHGVEITDDRPVGPPTADILRAHGCSDPVTDIASEAGVGACADPDDGAEGVEASLGNSTHAPEARAGACAGPDDSGAPPPPRLVPQSLAAGRRRAVLLARDAVGHAAICRFTTRRQVSRGFDLRRELPGFLAADADGGRGHLFCLTDSEELLAALAAKPGQLAATGDSLRVLLTTAGGLAGPDRRRLRRLADWAEARQVPVVAGADAYAAAPNGLALQKLLSTIRTGATLSSVEASACAPAGAWLRPPVEMELLLCEFPAACPESDAVADACRFRFELGKWRYPAFPLPPGEDADRMLARLCREGLARRFGGAVPPAAEERLARELAVVAQLGFAGYLLIVWDIVRHAGERGVPSVGRGSAANALVCYALGITHVDPLAHDLYFERFLNPERVSPPDIDLDFGWKDRDAILAYVYRKYGRSRATMICNLNRFSARSAFREVAKAHGYGDDDVGAITRRLPRAALDDPDWTPDRVPEASSLPLSREPYRSILAAARALNRFPRHLGIHAGGLVLDRQPLTHLFPLQWAHKGILVSQLDMYAVEALGLVKIDLLSQRGLAVIADAARAVARHHGVRFDLGWLPDGDDATRRLMREGRTLGCFYVESPAMRSLLRRLRADTFPVVVAASSVIRPGPSDSGMGRSFVRRHLGLEPPTLPHPRLTFLRETHGVMIYQEDVMRTLSAVAGFTLGEADLMRRAMSFKGRAEEFLALQGRFLEGARATGAAREVGAAGIAELWRQVSSFAGYAFCKAHSASYAVLSFQAAWLKAHYPAEFMAAVLDNGGGYYTTAVYLEEARRLGLRILLPDVNRSEAGFTGRDGAVRIGLGQVHGLSQRSLAQIVAARRAGGPFATLDDLLARVPALSRPEVDDLIRCGACDSLGPTRPELLWRHALLRRWQTGGGRAAGGGRRQAGGGHREAALARDAGAVRYGAAGGPPAIARRAGGRRGVPAAPPPLTLFGVEGALALAAQPAAQPATESQPRLVPGLADFTPEEKLRHELAILHLAASGHPLVLLRERLRQRGAVPVGELPGLAGRRVRVAGLLVTAKTARVHKTGERMKFLTLEDETGLCEVTLFPRVYRRYGRLLLTRGPYLVAGRVEDDHGAISLTAEEVEVV